MTRFIDTTKHYPYKVLAKQHCLKPQKGMHPNNNRYEYQTVDIQVGTYSASAIQLQD